MVYRDRFNEELKRCECGQCDLMIRKYDKRGRLKRFANYHGNRGIKHTEETRRKFSEAQKGKRLSESTRRKMSEYRKGRPMNEKNRLWKGDDVGIEALHAYVRRYFPKRDLCILCREKPPRDLANITGIYNRDLRNWDWFCRKCHQVFDNIHERRKITIRNKKLK